ncbi:MAG: hypothetical protein QUS14_11035 [Pyrinomonadaceae bacterium]|nr:hypothetical protein [Pyrinomonadaceae bacterium]
MERTKHDVTEADVDLGYERNDIQVKGIVYFTVGLAILIVITFALMWALYGVLEQNAQDSQGPKNPMQLSQAQRLPAEPRLQGAPGFGVDGPDGRINLELTAPQSEYWELEKQWKEAWEKGTKDKATGTVISLPIEEAKKKVLEQNLKARSGPEVEKLAVESRKYYTDASAGRLAAEIKR